MTIFSDAKNKVVDEKHIQALNDDGIDVREDVIEKVKKGDAEAIYTIGCMYVCKKEKGKAILWLGTSSALGFYESQIELGKLFAETYPQAALRWYTLARDNGLKHAHVLLGDLYLQQGSYIEAHDEYLEAANNGDPYSQNCLGELYVKSYTTDDSDYDDVYSEDNISAALGWFLKAASQDYVIAQYNIATLYEVGLGVARDLYEALRWYEKAKTGGYEAASAKVKLLNEEGYFYIPQEGAFTSTN